MTKRYISINSDSTEYVKIGDKVNDVFTAIDLSTYVKIELRLQYQNKITEIETYKTTDGTLVREDDTNGLLLFYLKRAVTAELTANQDIYCVITLYLTDTNFGTNIKKITLPQSYLFTTEQDSSYDN
jgi:hypothetical protein